MNRKPRRRIMLTVEWREHPERNYTTTRDTYGTTQRALRNALKDYWGSLKYSPDKPDTITAHFTPLRYSTVG